jgi:Fe-S cluster assembly protein SufD
MVVDPNFLSTLDPKDPLLHWRKKHWDRYQEIGWPKEAFQYLPAKSLSFPAPAEPAAPTLAPYHTYQIVFSDGHFSPEHSRLPSGVVCLPLDEAIRSYAIFLQNRTSRALKDECDPLALLNGAFQGRGCFLYIPPKMKIEEPIALLQLFSAEKMASPRIVLYVGSQSEMKIEQRCSAAHFCNAHFDAQLDEGADLQYQSAFDSRSSNFFQSIRASLKKNSRFAARFYSEGASSARISLRVQLLEENSEALLQGLSKLDSEKQNHIHALVEHLAPFTRSRQHFKGILSGKAKASFEGKIYVHPSAQKTEAYQLNNTLLLSDEAVAYAKPNLEIFADDVKASHGATIAQLDAEDLFYLRSRGLSLAEAKRWLVEGFCRELLECIPKELR